MLAACFVNKVLLGYILSLAVFTWQLKSWVVAIETVWPTKPNVFIIWPLQKDLSDPVLECKSYEHRCFASLLIPVSLALRNLLGT